MLLWIFDEIHKYKSWKNWLKGVYDKFHDQKKILVTGSAKLDLYSRGGDSLQGRYFLYRLHPVTLSELVGNEFSEDFSWFQDFSHTQKIQEALVQLLQRGGFPEPLLKETLIVGE
jgi:predicted AAA+ superfamily ATPase